MIIHNENTIHDYKIRETLDANPEVTLYRAVRLADDVPVLLKVSAADIASPKKLACLKREAEFLAGHHLPGVVQLYAVERHAGRLTLVFEDTGGEALRHWISRRRPLQESLSVAVELARVLQTIHDAGIIHRNINQNNVFYNPETGQVKVMGFECATRLLSAHVAQTQYDLLDVTLAYIAPEQTGRMNRAVDNRTDLYSLGATLYELFTGRCLHETDDPMEMVAFQLARYPKPPHIVDPELPEPLSRLVMKLLRKDPEERYQSAGGVLADLEHCFEELRHSGTIRVFELGTRDVRNRFEVPQKLYGRHREVAELYTILDRVLTSKSVETLLLAGYSGIGKTSLVRELGSAVTEQHGYFVQGKFEQLRRATPYHAISQSMGKLLLFLLGEREESVAGLRTRLLDALGANGGVIAEVVPELTRIIGPQPAVPELTGALAQNRFKAVFREFLAALSFEDRPIVVLLDDMQWADSASLGLLESLVVDPSARTVLFIEAYRDNEVTSTHPFMLAVEEQRRRGARLTSMTLGPVDEQAVLEMLSDTMRERADFMPELASLIYRKTGGNPFFIRQFLSTLHDESLISFDKTTGYYRFDKSKIEGKHLTDNVGDLLSKKLAGFPLKTQQALKLGSAFGGQFDIDLVAQLAGDAAQAVHDALVAATEADLIWPAGDEALGHGDESTGDLLLYRQFSFSHDKIQQAAYELIDDTERPELHLSIGRLLERAGRTVDVFDVVGQLNLGISRIADREELLRVAQLNLRAGDAAKDAGACAIAVGYFRHVIKALGEDPWTSCYADCYDAYAKLAESLGASGEFKESIEVIEHAATHAASDYDLARLRSLQTHLHIGAGDMYEALTWAAEAARLLGLELPDDLEKAQQQLETEIGRIYQRIAETPIESLIDLPAMEDPRTIALVELLARCQPAAYQVNPPLFGLNTCHMVSLSFEHGNCPTSAYGYGTFGCTLSVGLNEYDSGYRFGKLGVALSQKWGDPATRAATLFAHTAFCAPWRLSLMDGVLPGLRAVIRTGLETGDLPHAGYATIQMVMNLFACGMPLPQVEVENLENEQLLRRIVDGTNLDVAPPWRQLVRALRGKLVDGTKLEGEDFDEAAHLERLVATGNGSTLCFYYIARLAHRFLVGDYRTACESAQVIQENAAFAAGFYVSAIAQFFTALAFAAQCPTGTAREQDEALQRIDDIAAQLEQWRQGCPENFAHLQQVVAAEQARISGELYQAMALYEQASASAHDVDCLYVEAIAQERAGRMWRDAKRTDLATLYLRRAQQTYTLWGATFKVDQLERELTDLVATHSANSGDLEQQTKMVTAGNLTLDLHAIIKAARAISRELKFERLLETLMRICVENAGAELGSLVLMEDGKLLIQAELTAGGEAIEVLQNKPIDGAQLPETIVRYVFRTCESVVLDDAVRAESHTNDAYIRQSQPKSVLCAPIVHKGTALGVLYLENNLTTGAFTTDRIAALGILLSQIAISIENAMLFAKQEAQAIELARYRDHLEEIIEHRTAELKAAQKRLLDLSRQAGMAEVAAGVLHNVGNTLNSINVALQVVDETISNMHINNLDKIVDMLKENAGTLDVFLTTDPIGAKLIDYMDQLVDDLARQREGVLKENKLVYERVQHIKTVVSKQQKYAKPVVVTETCDVSDLIHEAIVLTEASFEKQGTALEIECETLPPVTVDRHHVLQILVNLLRNAVHAVQKGKQNVPKRISINARREEGDRFSIRVTDTGVGIPAENLPRVFEHGFTTKIDGHGFGLHNAGNTAKVMGGKLACQSDGPDRGAEFTLVLPISRPQQADGSAFLSNKEKKETDLSC